MGIERLNPVWWMTGISYSEVGTETALKDQKKLFSKARDNIRIVATEVPKIEVLEQALERGLDVQVVLGPGQDYRDLRSLSRRGVSFYELEEPPEESFAVADGKLVVLQQPFIPGRRQDQYTLNDDAHAPQYFFKFENLKGEAKALE